MASPVVLLGAAFLLPKGRVEGALTWWMGVTALGFVTFSVAMVW